MDSINIAYRQKDDTVEGIVLVKTAQVRISSNGSRYIDATIMDNTGEINAKGWNWGDQLCPDANSAVYIKGLVTEFNGKLQLRLDKLRLATDDEVEWEKLIPCAPENSEKMYKELTAAAEGLKNTQLKGLCTYILLQNRDKLLLWPAAVSYHHAERGGLMHHTLTMLRAAKALLPIYPQLNADLVISGVILHDMCKIDEIDANELGLASEYTVRGTLLGHIALGMATIERVGREMGMDEMLLSMVEHLVLSHHDTAEYGSPRSPMTPEAEMLHFLDILDARMFEMDYALAATPEGQFSERVRALENRRIFKYTPKAE